MDSNNCLSPKIADKFYKCNCVCSAFFGCAHPWNTLLLLDYEKMANASHVNIAKFWNMKCLSKRADLVVWVSVQCPNTQPLEKQLVMWWKCSWKCLLGDIRNTQHWLTHYLWVPPSFLKDPLQELVFLVAAGQHVMRCVHVNSAFTYLSHCILNSWPSWKASVSKRSRIVFSSC